MIRILLFIGLISVASFVQAAGDPFAPIAERMAEFVAEGQVTGVVTLVARQGEVVDLAAVGMADVEQSRPMAADTMFRIASMTKPITATALMILVDEGKLSVDEPVEKYIPAFAHAKLESGEPVRGLTIRHLLTHTSGLTGEQECETSLAATAEMLAERPFAFQPGEKWEYGPSLNVCGRIIEIVSGQPYEEFVAERILRPLAMFNTTFHPTDRQWQRVATVYKPGAKAGTLVPVPNDKLKITGAAQSVPSPSGGLFSTAGDMLRFYQMILSGGELGGRRIVSAEAVRAMTAPQTGALVTGFTPGNGWGLGWCVVREPQGVTAMLSPGTFGHGGLYGTEGWVDPQRQTIFVLMLARDEWGNSDGSDVRRDFQQLAVRALDKE